MRDALSSLNPNPRCVSPGWLLCSCYINGGMKPLKRLFRRFELLDLRITPAAIRVAKFLLMVELPWRLPTLFDARWLLIRTRLQQPVLCSVELFCLLATPKRPCQNCDGARPASPIMFLASIRSLLPPLRLAEWTKLSTHYVKRSAFNLIGFPKTTRERGSFGTKQMQSGSRRRSLRRDGKVIWRTTKHLQRTP